MRTASDRPRGYSDHAILLFVVYRLRSEEVQGLQLDDFDWDREVIHIARQKPRTVSSTSWHRRSVKQFSGIRRK